MFFTDLMRKIGIFNWFYAKKWRFLQIKREKLAFFGVNFILQKIWLCKKNDKYQVCVPYILKSVSRIAVRDFEKTLNILMCCIIWFRVKTVKAGWEIKSQISDFAQEWRRQWGNWENFWTKENNIQRCTRSDSKGSGPFSMKLEIPCFYLGT